MADGAFATNNRTLKDTTWCFVGIYCISLTVLISRGLTVVDVSQLATETDWFNCNTDNCKSNELRKHRIKAMMIDTLDFMKPKLFSSTRMCLFEHDQLKRFVEMMHYFDVPWHYEVMAKLMVFVVYAEKTMLKMLQKTEDRELYVCRVVVGTPNQFPSTRRKDGHGTGLQIGKRCNPQECNHKP